MVLMFSVLQVIQDEMRQRDVLLEDEEEDFLDEATVNPHSRGCPPALLLCAAAVLTEITAFMRETYKSVPKAGKVSRQVKASVEIGGGAAGLASLGGGGARRWSYANQSLAGQSNASHQSLHNSSDNGKMGLSLQRSYKRLSWMNLLIFLLNPDFCRVDLNEPIFS